jgi:RNA polymerase sigma-70 factor (ECF subfamily)
MVAKMNRTPSTQPSCEVRRKTARAHFTETRWSKLFEARVAGGTERRAIHDFLIRCYWKPVYCYLRRSGCDEEDAKDYVQEFFAVCLRDNFFDKADPKLGRFRDFLLTGGNART